MTALSEIQSRLLAIRRKERGLAGMTGLFRVSTTLSAGLLGHFLLDWLFDLPFGARWLSALLVAGLAGYVFYRYVFQELSRKQDEDQMALRVEARHPDLRSRLISILQLRRAGEAGVYTGSPELLQALEQETLELAGPLNFSAIIHTEALKKAGIALATVAALQIALAARFPEHFLALAARLTNPAARYPTRTKIQAFTAPEYVARGDDITVEVLAGGAVPAQAGTLLFKLAGSGAEIPVELAAAGGNLFTGRLEKALENAEFTIRLGDAFGPGRLVRVLRRPEVDTFASTVQYHFPPYTRSTDEPPPVPDKFGALAAPAGSRVDLHLVMTKPLVRATLDRADGSSYNLVPADETGLRWKLEGLPLDKSTSFHLLLLDTDQLTNSLPPLEFPIEPRPDQWPTVKLLRPRRDLTVTPAARTQVVFSAQDDYRVRAVRVAYRVQRKIERSDPEVKYYDLPSLPSGKDLQNLPFTWGLAALNVQPGDEVVFWLEADDDCRAPGHRPRKRGWRESSATPLDPQEKVWSRTNDIKLVVISREEKRLELQAELERLAQALASARENHFEVKDEIRNLQHELWKLNQPPEQDQ